MSGYVATISFNLLTKGVTKEEILRSDKKMLDEWRYELEILWYE
jgi:hypothetical protein